MNRFNSHRTFVLLMSAALVFAACGEPERPVWGFSGASLEEMDLENHLHFGGEDTAVVPADGCQQVMKMRLRSVFPATGPDPEEIRAFLRGAKDVEVSCVGSCGGKICRTQHRTALKTKLQKARTRCICDLRDSPCAFNVEWELGDETRRRVLELACEAGEGSGGSCGFLVLGSGREMRLTCQDG